MISGVMTFIAVLLINASIRLALYSNRFIIKTMQMVGATKRFIRKPFMTTNIKLGILGAFVALSGIGSLMAYLDLVFPSLGLLNDPITLSVVALGVFSLGAVIAGISTYFAAQRFLNLRTAALY